METLARHDLNALQASLSATGRQDYKHYVEPERTNLDLTAWPATVCTYSPALHDLTHYQALLRNDNNFVVDGASKLKIIEIGQSLVGNLMCEDDKTALDYFETAQQSGLTQSSSPSYRIIFCTIEKVSAELQTSFCHKLSVSRTVLEKMLSTFHVAPSFLSKLVGEPDYWSPEFAERSGSGQSPGQCIHLSCQHPRWNIHKSPTPLSVYMAFDNSTRCTTYILVGGAKCEVTDRVNERLRDFAAVMKAKARTHEDVDPLLIHCLVSKASLETSKGVFNKLRGRLYEVLDQVDNFAAKRFDDDPHKREILAKATVELSDVSQNFDSTLASLEMAERIAEHLEEADRGLCVMRLTENPDLAQAASRTGRLTSPSANAVKYIKQSISAQIHWLRSWKARKDTSLSLVFNLVTQQDAASAALTATAAQADGSSMKAIAALTMLFLPATFLATLFGIQDLHIAEWSNYFIVVVPMTIVVFIAWFMWEYRSFVHRVLAVPAQKLKSRILRRKSNVQEDLEIGAVRTGTGSTQDVAKAKATLITVQSVRSDVSSSSVST